MAPSRGHLKGCIGGLNRSDICPQSCLRSLTIRGKAVLWLRAQGTGWGIQVSALLQTSCEVLNLQQISWVEMHRRFGPQGHAYSCSLALWCSWSQVDSSPASPEGLKELLLHLSGAYELYLLVKRLRVLGSKAHHGVCGQCHGTVMKYSSEKPITQLIPSSQRHTLTPGREHVVTPSLSSQDFVLPMSKMRCLASLGDPAVRQLKGSHFQKVEAKHFLSISENPHLTVSTQWKNPIAVFTCSWQCRVAFPVQSTPWCGGEFHWHPHAPLAVNGLR